MTISLKLKKMSSTFPKVKITTMTLCTSLNSRLDLDLLIKFFKAFYPQYKIKYTKGNRRSSSNSMFFNSFSFTMKVKVRSVKNKVNVKLFKSGSVHITGCKDLLSSRAIPRKLFNIVLECCPAILDEKTYSLSDTRIVMMNAMYKLDKKVNRQCLYEHLLSIGEVDVRFDPEKYHGIILKHKGVTFFFFYSGVVLMTSNGDDLKSYTSAYRSVQKIMSTCPKDVFLS